VNRLLATFPEEVQKAWKDTQAHEVANSPRGALPRKK
jgi:hypothetical protein